MSTFFERLKKEEQVSAEEWKDFLREAHQKAPSMTPLAFAEYKTREGISSYEQLASALKGEEQALVDLACGDGYLSTLLVKSNPRLEISGVDMSEGELNVAKEKFKNGEKIKLILSEASKTGLLDQSQDAVLCHLAFMLMLPIEDVVVELKRILKPGGVFSAIVGKPPTEGSMYLKIQQLVVGFFFEKFNISKLPNSGDSRTSSEDGFRQLFGEDDWQDLKVHDFDLEVRANVDQAIEQWQDMYYVGALPSDLKAELLQRLREFFSQYLENGKVSYLFPLRQVTVVRK